MRVIRTINGKEVEKQDLKNYTVRKPDISRIVADVLDRTGEDNSKR